jgi:biopolymer transport protein ExbB
MLAVLVGLWPAMAEAWWSPEWTQRKTLTLDTTGTGANLQQPIADATVLLRLHAGNFPQFLNVRDGGADFRLISGDDATPLKYHVERFDPVAQIALVWVKAANVNPQATGDELYLYFGNQSAVKGDDPGASFDVDTVAAYHFDETVGVPVDSTAYGTQVVSGEPFANPASLIGAGATLPGTEALVIGDAPQLRMTPDTGWTFSTWIRLNTLPEAPGYLFDRQDSAGRLSLLVNGSALTARYADVEINAARPLVAGQWHHVSLVIGNGELQIYLDGALAGRAPVTLAELGGAVYIGGGADGGGLLGVDLDELRLSRVARSADWIGFDAAVQGERNDAVLTYGADESSDAEGEAGAAAAQVGYFGIIFQHVFGRKEAIIEQAVIIVCGIMAAIALLVMFFKFLQLTRARASSEGFLGAYRALAAGGGGGGDLQSLYEGEETYGRSPLYAVYRRAIEELRGRTSAAVGAQPAGLDAKSINAVKAALDAAMVREGQRLDSQMVLLTIAISGGPFIGLFGTVVGVMVTFAAIAATGDVNITAIAPGMAAALLATVAGLGVAIPSLFGYNYLGSRIRELSADMHVFADELVARINEEYGV